jgi:hypothetical protein
MTEWTTEGPIDPEKQDERQQSHFHRCSRCSDPIECWCEFPEVSFNDSFSLCALCNAKRYSDKKVRT